MTRYRMIHAAVEMWPYTTIWLVRVELDLSYVLTEVYMGNNIVCEDMQ